VSLSGNRAVAPYRWRVTATTDTTSLAQVSPTAPATAAVVRPVPSPRTPDPTESSTAGALARLASLRTRRLTAPGSVVLALLLLTPGVLTDLAQDGTFGVPSAASFVAASVAAALVVRVRSLATAAVLPPLLFVTAVAVLAQLSGNNEGSRELVLDVGTTLAISAPLLFAGTAAAVAVVLGRLVLRLARRSVR
jgi:hypothetical protein